MGGRGIAVRWRIAILLCLITTINYIDRLAFAVAWPAVTEELSLSNTGFGLIWSGFLFAYAIGHLLVGPVIDRFGTKRSFSVAALAWSIAGMLTACAQSFWGFLGFRTLLGAAEATNFPAALKAVAEWFPKADRSLAVGIVTMGPGLGAVLSPPLLGWLILGWGWRAAFIVPGAVGLLWLWVWRRYYHRPAEHPGIGPQELELIRADQPAEQASEHGWSLGSLLRRREMWGLMLARFMNDGAFYFFMAWVPLYLAQERGFDIKQIALFAWMPYLAADFGSVGGGWLGGRLMRSGMSLDQSRKWVIWGGALMVLTALPVAGVQSPYAAIALIAIAMFSIQAKAANLFALPADLYPVTAVGKSWGLFGAVGAFGGMVFEGVAGWATDQVGYAPVFGAVAVTQLLSAAFVSLLIPKIRMLDVK